VPMYQTSARVLIQDERTVAVGKLSPDQTFYQETEPYYRTQYQILQSRGLARRVVHRLDLQNHPDFNGTAPPREDPLSVIRRARASASAWARSLIARQSNEVPAPPAPDETTVESGLISAFLSGVQIVPLRDTRLVDIVYRHTNPDFAALAANMIADEYTAQNLDLRLQNTDKMLKEVTDQLQKSEAALIESEDALTRYRETNNALSLDDRQNITTQRLNTLNETATRARTTRLTRESQYNQIRGADPASDSADAFPLIGNNTAVVEAKNRLNTLTTRRATLSRQFGPEWPEMKTLATEIDNATRQLKADRAKVIESIRNDYQAAAAEEQSFSRQLDQQKSESMDLDRKSGDYRMIQRVADSNRQIYQSLLDQQKQLAVVANSRANNVQVMDRAEVQRVPYSPNTRRDLLTAILAGLVFALGLAFGIEYLDDTIKTPEDVTKRLKLPLLGLVPGVRGHRVPVLTETVPHDFGEAFRSLRTSLVFTSGGQSTRVIAVTSSQPLEGKTITACNLALALSLGGARVLLIDGDMRRPGLHKTMGLQNGIGLSHMLVGQARVRDVIQRMSEPNLFVITAGRPPPNPSELLASERMRAFITNLEHGPFEWVIIDTPPVLAVTDAVILTQQVSGVVFVIGSEMTRRAHAQRALETLQGGKLPGLAAVLNRVDFDRNKYYYSRYYG
ncbi:MAG: polysaccharide biosynthesis tyrosine autokinase, partial [Acidobacteria bacterium]|nr:polysaccharide biosynthesis tyrosine autokinase [Acidobacteriota bacterium]